VSFVLCDGLSFSSLAWAFKSYQVNIQTSTWHAMPFTSTF